MLAKAKYNAQILLMPEGAAEDKSDHIYPES